MTEENVERQEPAADKRRSGPSVNKVILIGRLAADPDMRFTAAGEPVAQMRLATNGPERADFHTLVAFGSQASFAGDYLSKGRLVYVEGRLQTREWTGQDGGKRYTTEVVTHNVQALGTRPQRDELQRGEAEQETER